MSPEQITEALNETCQHRGMTGVPLVKKIVDSMRRDGKSHDEIIATVSNTKLFVGSAESFRDYLVKRDKRNADAEAAAIAKAAAARAEVAEAVVRSLTPRTSSGFRGAPDCVHYPSGLPICSLSVLMRANPR